MDGQLPQRPGDAARVMGLLRDGVPLSLLVDVAGLGPDSATLLAAERYDPGEVASAADAGAAAGRPGVAVPAPRHRLA